ncbi:GFA family protein [Flexibacterium corallicola]|uniref:GFA family protein n=1 Tax=Flexibacterium corallicola TaxID=3037259 RepID=UPI00286FA20C|nr:GFA family protein [Pseudovibrio sp. M1P-2-3]
MITGSCHCGAVKFELDMEPEWLTECNCSACRKMGTVWAHAELDKIKIISEPDATLSYQWGDHTLEFHSCKTCGCTSHWSPLGEGNRMAVNMKLTELDEVSRHKIRHFDGADTWRYLD